MIANFIDGGHLHQILRRHSIPRYDLRKLAAHMAGGRATFQTTYYDCLPYLPAHPTEADTLRFDRRNRYFRALSRLQGVHVKLGKLVPSDTGRVGKREFQQKRVDVAIGVDIAMTAVRGFTTDVALLSADSDLLPGIEAAQAEGLLVHLFHGANSSRDLIETCDSSTLIPAKWLVPSSEYPACV